MFPGHLPSIIVVLAPAARVDPALAAVVIDVWSGDLEPPTNLPNSLNEALASASSDSDEVLAALEQALASTAERTHPYADGAAPRNPAGGIAIRPVARAHERLHGPWR